MSIFDEIETMLDQHYTAAPETKAIMHNRQSAACLAEIVFDSLFFADHSKHFDIDFYDIDFLAEKCPSLIAHDFTGFYGFGLDNIGVQLLPGMSDSQQELRGEEQATNDLTDWIMADAELALCCWNIAQQIATQGFWSEGDYAFDAMVQLGLKPMYEGFEEVCAEVKR